MQMWSAMKRRICSKTESAVFYHDDLAELNLPYSITDALHARILTAWVFAKRNITTCGASLLDHTAASLAQLAAGDVFAANNIWTI